MSELDARSSRPQVVMICQDRAVCSMFATLYVKSAYSVRDIQYFTNHKTTATYTTVSRRGDSYLDTLCRMLTSPRRHDNLLPQIPCKIIHAAISITISASSRYKISPAHYPDEYKKEARIVKTSDLVRKEIGQGTYQCWQVGRTGSVQCRTKAWL